MMAGDDTLQKITLGLIVLVTLACVWVPQAKAAEGPSTSPAPPAGTSANTAGDATDGGGAGAVAPKQWTFWEIIQASGWCGALIILSSVAAGALVIEFLLTIRTSVLIPPGLEQELRELVGSGNANRAEERCHMQPSFFSYVVSAGLAETDAGWPAVEKALEDALAEQTARLMRKVEYLAVIGNIAPMLGLLGTVLGMVMAFKQVAETQGAARAADLAEGIYLALVTTIEGLIVAIPALAVFAYFRNRVDELVAEVAYVAQQVFVPMRRKRGASPPRVPDLPKPPPPAPRGAKS